MKIILITMHLLFITINSFSQVYDSLPKNSETKKVSISRVVNLPNTHKAEIYNRMHDWYILRTNGLIRQETTKFNDKKGDYQLISIEYINFDPNNLDSLSKNKQKLIYKVTLSQIKQGIGTKWKSGYENAFCILLIKDGRYKIEFTDFYHLVADNYSVGSGYEGAQWKYDEEVSPSLFGSKSKWKDVRLEGINKYQKLMNDIIIYLAKPSQTNMDF